MGKILFTIFMIFILSANSIAGEIYGQAKVTDGDSLRINNYKIRLEGIDAPELKQNCKKDHLKLSLIIGISFNKKYACGIKSKKALLKKVNNSSIKCSYSTKDRYGRYLSTCFKKNINLNSWMVKNGHAIAYRKYSKKYILDENHARDNKLGIWSGSFLEPEKWRKLN